MSYTIPHNEPSLSMVLDLHEAILIADALMRRREERFGTPFPDGAEVTWDELVGKLGSDQDAEDFLAMVELENAIIESLRVFEEPEEA